jgi:uncharacterized protein (DUF433 family)
MKWTDFISQNPEIMMGKPCLRGTRLTVETILDKLGHGVTYEELLESYPALTRDHILAAQCFAADYLSMDQVVWSPHQPA